MVSFPGLGLYLLGKIIQLPRVTAYLQPAQVIGSHSHRFPDVLQVPSSAAFFCSTFEIINTALLNGCQSTVGNTARLWHWPNPYGLVSSSWQTTALPQPWLHSRFRKCREQSWAEGHRAVLDGCWVSSLPRSSGDPVSL